MSCVRKRRMTNTDELHRDRTTWKKIQSHTSPVGQKGSTAKNKTVPGNETETLECKCKLPELHVTHAKEPRMKRMKRKKRNPSKRLEILKK